MCRPEILTSDIVSYGASEMTAFLNAKLWYFAVPTQVVRRGIKRIVTDANLCRVHTYRIRSKLAGKANPPLGGTFPDDPSAEPSESG